MRTPLAFAILLAACSGSTTGDDAGDDGTGPDAGPGAYSTDPFEGLPTGVDQWTALCAKGYADTVTQVFCAGPTPPPLTSLADLRVLLGLELVPGQNASATGGNPGFAVAHLSTAVGMRHVNELNPRVVIFTLPRGGINPSTPLPNPTYDILAF